MSVNFYEVHAVDRTKSMLIVKQSVVRNPEIWWEAGTWPKKVDVPCL